MRIAVLIDGGHTRVLARKANIRYDPDLIEALAHHVIDPDQTLLRALYYDCAPYNGAVRLPVSGQERHFDDSGAWLNELARRDFFAVRRGVLKFRGFKPRRVPVSPRELTDDDFKPDFEQKGVDMRIGLDMATLAQTRAVDRIVLFSNDTDCIPAMKHVRKAGLQVMLPQLPDQHIPGELREHADLCQRIGFPEMHRPQAPD